MKKVLALSLVLSGSLFAANNLFEITPQVGGTFHIDNDRYKDSADLSYGLKFASRVAPSVLVELGYDRADTAKGSEPRQSTDINRYYVNLVKEFEVWDKTDIYILGGFGYEDLRHNFQNMDDDFFGQYGVGLRHELAEYLHLKTEVRHLASFDGRSDVIAMVGFSIPFGTYTQPEPEPTPASAPALSHIHQFSVQFPFDSTNIAPEYNAEIADFAEYMKQNPNQTAIINGHTDSTGSAVYNQKLSERRATAVKEKIIEEGVAPERLESKGYGATQPVATNATSEGRKQNRRVEAEVYTK
ncbi:OmpA family protein [Helicobacter sp. MIT 05-5294]|uniref:OmpA family protein n=1 Tax=Helicobacter sp. MIT 05-5294 TaxID=1548150 RepID=UPI00051F8837|nr:OmpA family protein [Helicobacter sp. MIT 05-5294]TLD89134.1 OmpA family protein [Helicobacter sp. MIT 05-5294]